MQAIIMAAGRGSRMGELTKNKPKSFLSIQGKTLLAHNLDMLHHYGIWDITIVVGYRDSDFTKATANIPGIKLVYNPFYMQMNVLGSYWMGCDELHDSFVYLHADTICDNKIFEELLVADGDIVLPIDTKPCDDEAMKVRIVKGRVVEITKEMPVQEAAGEFIGVAKIDKSVINDLNLQTERLLREERFSSYFEAAIQRLIEMGRYSVRIIDVKDKFWAEIDCLEDYKRACELVSTMSKDVDIE